MIPSDLLRRAEVSATEGMVGSSGQPSETDLRAAISSAYYALFHTICRYSADLLTAPDPEGLLAQNIWLEVYRNLDHRQAARNCRTAMNTHAFCSEIKFFANTFVRLQQNRHEADYNPHAPISQTRANQLVIEARNAIDNLALAPEREIKLFVAHLNARSR